MNTLIYLVSQRKSPARLCWAFRFTLYKLGVTPSICGTQELYRDINET